MDEAFISETVGVLDVQFGISKDTLLRDNRRCRGLQFRGLFFPPSAFERSGAKIALDDFGSGYASLANLRHLPLDRVKLDRSLVDGIDTNTKDMAIARNIIGIASVLDLAVIAEGVERSSQRKILSAIGCGFAQGFYYGRPDSRQLTESKFIDISGTAITNTIASEEAVFQ